MIKTYEGFFTEDFKDGLRHFSGLKKQIQKKVDAILLDPYYNTESLGKGRWADLRGVSGQPLNVEVFSSAHLFTKIVVQYSRVTPEGPPIVISRFHKSPSMLQ